MDNQIFAGDLVWMVLKQSGLKKFSVKNLTNCLDEASLNFKGLWQAFTKDPRYGDSRILTESLAALTLGGSVYWNGHGADQMMVDKSYSSIQYSFLEPELRSQVNSVALQLASIEKSDEILTR